MPAIHDASVVLRLLVSALGSFALAVALLTVVAPAADAHRGGSGWDCLAHYESTHRWHINTGNGHYGGLQFSLSTWRYYGGPNYSKNTYPHNATRQEQIVIAKRVAWHGWNDRRPQGGGSAWPNTWYRCF
ncbi:MAG: transglycosylase family protein [Nocardioides sp.]